MLPIPQIDSNQTLKTNQCLFFNGLKYVRKGWKLLYRMIPHLLDFLIILNCFDCLRIAISVSSKSKRVPPADAKLGRIFSQRLPGLSKGGLVADLVPHSRARIELQKSSGRIGLTNRPYDARGDVRFL